MHADRTNRVTLTIAGLLCLGAGVGTLLASLGVFSPALKNKTLFDNRISRYVGAHGSWIWAAAALAAALLVIVCLSWLRVLVVPTERPADLTVAGDRSQGVTRIRPGAVTSALTAEIESYRGVKSARTRISGGSAKPRLSLTVTAAADTDLDQLRQRIEIHALSHARQALTSPDMPIRLDLTIGKR